ncbi:MAG: methyltransferase domain-containing protein [Bacillota bacterium]|nr:methyltransferase domain-containing protein [Bacillota bacterium]
MPEPCKLKDICGGCTYQGMAYEEQLALKSRTVTDLLREKNVPFECFPGIEGAPSPYAYRNKMEYTFGDETKGGEMTLGLHKAGSYMSVVTADSCQLVDPDFNRILKATLDFCRERGYAFYHKKSHRGYLRNLAIRKGVRTGELLVNLITAGDGGPDGAGGCGERPGGAGQWALDEGAWRDLILGLPLKNKVVGLLHGINDDPADAVRCRELRILSGRDYYMEEILGLRFKVTPFAFFQTNVEAVERLYREALELIPDLDGKVAFDLYCGTGTITQALALKARRAIGVELSPEAVAAARENAALNGLENCSFIAGDVLRVLDQIEEQPDVIVVDPPRSGIHPKAMQKILNYGVKEIIYISCNPKTLAENLVSATENGYRVKSVKAYDNFPFTKHVETVCLLSKL